MSTLELIAALIVALKHDNAAAIAHTLSALDARMSPEEVADLLRALTSEEPPLPRRQEAALCVPMA